MSHKSIIKQQKKKKQAEVSYPPKIIIFVTWLDSLSFRTLDEFISFHFNSIQLKLFIENRLI